MEDPGFLVANFFDSGRVVANAENRPVSEKIELPGFRSWNAIYPLNEEKKTASSGPPLKKKSSYFSSNFSILSWSPSILRSSSSAGYS